MLLCVAIVGVPVHGHGQDDLAEIEDLVHAIGLALEGRGHQLLKLSSPHEMQRTPVQPDACPLSAREREVAVLVAEGLTNRQLAERLVIAERTVETHLERIFAKLNLSCRAALAVWAARHGLLAQRSASN